MLQCIRDGKSIIIEGSHLDPGLFLDEFGRYGVHMRLAMPAAPSSDHTDNAYRQASNGLTLAQADSKQYCSGHCIFWPAAAHEKSTCCKLAVSCTWCPIASRRPCLGSRLLKAVRPGPGSLLRTQAAADAGCPG